MERDVIIVFVKKPELGKVKTRIAKTLGNDEALRIYNYLLDYTLKVCKDTEMLCYIYFSEIVDDEARWHSKNFKHKKQMGLDLGIKMGFAFSELFESHSRAVIIGSDCPFITPQIIYKAFAALDSNPLCIGPAKDGGYYLLGMNFKKMGTKRIDSKNAVRTKIWRLFKDIEWSSDSVYDTTLDRAKEFNLSVKILPEFFDIDTQTDWEKYLAMTNKTVL